MARIDEAPTDPAPPPAGLLSLGERAVNWCRAQADGMPVPSSVRLALWFQPVGRGLEKMVIAGTRLNHCAAAQCAAAFECLLPGEEVPHLYRAGALQLKLDAIERHCWHEVSEVRSGAWKPSVGDLAIYSRYNPSNPKSEPWHAHVDRVSAVKASLYEAIGANEGPGGRWRIDQTPFSTPSILGFIEYPRPQVAPTAPLHLLTEGEVERVRELVALTLDRSEAAWWDAQRETMPDAG